VNGECVLQERTGPASQSDRPVDNVHSSSVDVTCASSTSAADVDHLTSALSASTLGSSQTVSVDRCRSISLMIPVRATQSQPPPEPAYHQSATQHSTAVTPASQSHSAPAQLTV